MKDEARELLERLVAWHTANGKTVYELDDILTASQAYLSRTPVEGPVAEKAKCERCDGCGQIADSDDGEPWTDWTSLPPPSDLAVRMGIVKPIPCPDCSGTVVEDREGGEG